MQRNKILWIWIFCISLCLHSNAQAQDPDELFKQARDAAFIEENYLKAIELAKEALAIAPEYLDVKEFLGRVYFWNDDFGSARPILEDVLSVDPKRIYSRESLIEIYLDLGENDSAEELTKYVLEYDPTNVRFLLLRARVLEKTGNISEIVETYNEILIIEPNNTFALSQLELYNINTMKWSATIGNDHSFFKQNLDNWSEFRFDLNRSTGFGTIGGNVKLGSRFGLDDQQFELYSYPIIGSKMYGYFAIGVSSNTFYPGYHFVGSLYRALPNRFEIELGYRYLSFDAVNVNILSTSLARYERKNRYILRGFYTLSESNNSYTALFVYRRILKRANNFIEINTGFGGNSGDFSSSNEILGTDRAYNIGVAYQHIINSKFTASINSSYVFEEYQNGLERDRYNVGLNINYRF